MRFAHTQRNRSHAATREAAECVGARGCGHLGREQAWQELQVLQVGDAKATASVASPVAAASAAAVAWAERAR